LRSAEELQKQLDVAKKEIARMSKLLTAAEAELQLWRSGEFLATGCLALGRVLHDPTPVCERPLFTAAQE
jgi:hypothetical protein